jgi:alpha-aminoadipic semialdehyde synthase
LNTIGIRREDKNRWERRAPLTPDQVGRLVREHGLSFVVQPSPTRIFDEDEYRAADAAVDESLDACPFVMAVKEIPPDLLRPGTAYVFFSHTAKGQESNLPLLRRVLDLGCTLLDYEKGVDDDGRRLFFFGREAGLVGAVESLRGLGLRLRARGHETPLLAVRPTHEYAGLDAIRSALREVGDAIRRDGFPLEVGPVIVGLTGDGHVSRGAREILELLPHRHLVPEDLDVPIAANGRPAREIGIVVFREPDMVRPLDPDRPFDLQEYYDHPERYRSVLDSRLRGLTLLMHCSYWEPQYPRIVSVDAVRRWSEDGAPMRLQLVGDISCDPKGGVEINRGVTTPDSPFYVYRPGDGEVVEGVEGDGIVVLAVDNLPCMLPRTASEGFGESLMPFLPGVAAADLDAPDPDASGLPAPLRRAVIAWRGRLEPRYAWLEELVR